MTAMHYAFTSEVESTFATPAGAGSGNYALPEGAGDVVAVENLADETTWIALSGGAGVVQPHGAGAHALSPGGLELFADIGGTTHLAVWGVNAVTLRMRRGTATRVEIFSPTVVV